MAEPASASSVPPVSEAKPAVSSFHVVTVTTPHPTGLDSAASKVASLAASVAVKMEAPLIKPSHSLGGAPPAGTRMLLTRTSSDLVIRLPPLHWANATLSFAVWSLLAVLAVLPDSHNHDGQPLPPIAPVLSTLFALFAAQKVREAFLVRTIQIDGCRLLDTWQLFGRRGQATIPTASICRVDLRKQVRGCIATYYCRISTGDGPHPMFGHHLDFGHHLSRAENTWLLQEVSAFLLGLGGPTSGQDRL
ncbi:hypothetical protein CLOM_g7976 [Closterium sp. NIES-68]|nr:hypothetical protein CLOM_g7976 [Closterium sp. NIES-68]GJP72911.1 hypothetical protein CLOP_g3681 [Closterium sp. NIES-67]